MRCKIVAALPDFWKYTCSSSTAMLERHEQAGKESLVQGFLFLLLLCAGVKFEVL